VTHIKKYKCFPSKILLFGEYTVLKGSGSLAFPFSSFTFSLINKNTDNFNGMISSFYNYLKEVNFEEYQLSFMEQEYMEFFKNGGYFESTIPIGYGLGSSGAFTCAVYTYFFDCKVKMSPTQLKRVFSKIENFFHGKSSGLDPLIIYLNKSIHINEDSKLKVLDKESGYFLVLIDSEMARSTQVFVELFNKKFENNIEFRKSISELSSLNASLIKNTLNCSAEEEIFSDFGKLSELQLKCLPEMITDKIFLPWKKSLQGAKHRIKLCGAGGGGFYLLLTKEIEDFRQNNPGLRLIKIF